MINSTFESILISKKRVRLICIDVEYTILPMPQIICPRIPNVESHICKDEVLNKLMFKDIKNYTLIKQQEQRQMRTMIITESSTTILYGKVRLWLERLKISCRTHRRNNLSVGCCWKKRSISPNPYIICIICTREFGTLYLSVYSQNWTFTKFGLAG